MAVKQASGFELPLAMLREQIAASDLLPAPYARYRPLLADGMRFFLERLSPSRLSNIFLEQSRMPVHTPMAQRVVALLHHLPTLHKVGQVLARDRRLSPEFRRHLQQLESLEPRTALPDILRLLDREFKGWRKANLQVAEHPLAEGSVAVVLPFSWRRGRETRPGVFKLLKAGIEALLEQDLAIWSDLGVFLDEQCHRYHLPSLDYQETFDTVRDLLVHEVRLQEEQAHLANAARIYASMPGVVIPEVFPFSTSRLTAMERIPGEALSAGLARNAAATLALAPIIAEALVARPFFSPQPDSWFHADPHAGNLFVLPDGRLGILDWSLAGCLRKPVREELIQLLLGALAHAPMHMTQALETLSLSPPKRNELYRVVLQSLRPLRWGKPAGIGWLTELLDQAVTQAGVRFSGDLLLFRKALLTLEGVLADVTGADVVCGANCLDGALYARFVGQFLREWPARFLRPHQSRDYSTHLSTSDLLSLLWSIPFTAGRFWAGAWSDLGRQGEVSR